MAFENEEIVATEWSYRTEGGQHLVFSYEGDSPHFLRKILRVRSMKKTSAVLKADDYALCDESAAEESLKKTDLRPFLLRQIPVQISSDSLLSFREAARGLRPLERVQTNVVPVDAMDALLQDDLALLFGNETLCVEIKPKSSCLSKSRLVHPRVCEQLKKFTDPEVHTRNFSDDEISSMRQEAKLYNPIDILSGDMYRIESSLKLLLGNKSRWLRIMASGTFVAATSQVGSNLPQKVLDYSDSRVRLAIGIAAKALAQKRECLDVLLRMQELDFVDRLGLETLWKRLICLKGKDDAVDMVWDKYLEAESLHLQNTEDEIAKWRSLISYNNAEEALALHSDGKYQEAMKAVEGIPLDICARIIADTIMSAVAKDCSILISLAPSEGSECGDGTSETVVGHDGSIWKFAIHVIDIGPKPLSKIHQWASLDRKLVQSHENVIAH